MTPRSLAMLACLVACGAGEDASCPITNDNGAAAVAPSGGTTFVAFAAHFQGYRRWTQTPGVPDPSLSADAISSVHVAGPMTVYVNRPPPAGSKEFPVGTVIVKELETGALGERTVFAMVKRGGTFNDGGAPGWEWFELQNTCDGVQILWRGVGPPAGEKYGGDPSGGCNTCHAHGKTNDFVMTKGLRLTP